MYKAFSGKRAFLSNFFPCSVKYAGLEFPSVENAYQFASLSPAAQEIREMREFLQRCTPAEAKRVARGSARLLPRDEQWHSRKVRVMRDLLEQKFAQPFFRDMLIRDGGPFVEENSWHDNFWGACVCSQCARKEKDNMLGRLIQEQFEGLK